MASACHVHLVFASVFPSSRCTVSSRLRPGLTQTMQGTGPGGGQNNLPLETQSVRTVASRRDVSCLAYMDDEGAKSGGLAAFCPRLVQCMYSVGGNSCTDVCEYSVFLAIMRATLMASKGRTSCMIHSRLSHLSQFLNQSLSFYSILQSCSSGSRIDRLDPRATAPAKHVNDRFALR